MKTFKRYLLDPSSISLLFSNLVVIFLALIQGWETATFLWVYWIQSVIIGLFNFLKILSLQKFSTENFTINNKQALPTVAIKTFTAFFFAFHYGLFHFIYAIFLTTFFRSDQGVSVVYLFSGGLIFFLNHLFSFYHNKLADQQKVQNLGQMMILPYGRIVPMHLIIVFGALFGQSTLIVFLLLKTFLDLGLHAIKHTAKQVAKSSSNF